METPKIPAAAIPDEDGMLPEYDFTGGARGKYAGRITARSKSVTLTPNVATVFADSDAVNAALRMLIDIARASAASNPASPSTNAASPESPA